MRLNGRHVLDAPFDEGGGEQGVVSILIEWIVLRDHELCCLVVLPSPFLRLSAGDEVTVTVVKGPLERSGEAEDAAKDLQPKSVSSGEPALSVSVGGGGYSRHIQNPRGVSAEVSWIQPTSAMKQRGVIPSLRVSSATGPDDIEGRRLEPGSVVVFRLSVAPVADASGSEASVPIDAA